MLLIERIKEILNKQNKQLLLEEDKTKTLEDGVADYLGNLWSLSSKVQSNKLSYYALLEVNAHDNKDKGNNDKKEEKLIRKIEKKYNKYRLMWQPQSSEKPIHRYAIFNKDLDVDKLEKNSTRMYINLKRENISDFVREFIKQVGNHYFYAKFSSDIGAQKRKSSDPLVLYLKNEDKEYFDNIIRNISLKKPHLMEGTNQRNPFIAKGSSNSIAETPQPESGIIQLQDGRYMGVAKSYNNIISYILEDSFRDTLQKEIGNDIDIRKIDLLSLLDIFDDKIENIDTFIKKMTNTVVEGFKRNDISMTGLKSNTTNKDSFLENLHTEISNEDIKKSNKAISTNEEKEK